MSWNIFLLESNLFGPKVFTFSRDFTDNNNWNVLTLKIKELRYSSDYVVQPPPKSIRYKLIVLR